jgi:chitin synthase
MASTIGSLAAQAINSGDLVDLVSSSATATIYPTDDAILSALHSRFRADLPYTRIGTSNLVVVNPYKTLANVNDLSAKEYEDRCYKDTSLPLVDSPKPLQPHVYELAAKIYLLMRRRNESQSIITRCVLIIPVALSSLLTVEQWHHWVWKVGQQYVTHQSAPQIIIALPA